MGNGRRYLEYQGRAKNCFRAETGRFQNLFPQLKRHQASGCCRLRSELMQNSFTQARPRATSGRAQTSRAWKTRGRAGRNTRSRVLSSR